MQNKFVLLYYALSLFLGFSVQAQEVDFTTTCQEKIRKTNVYSPNKNYTIKSRLVNWSKLSYHSDIIYFIPIYPEDNFVSKLFSEKENKTRQFRQQAYWDLLQLPIDYELRLDHLINLDKEFKNAFREKLYQPNFIRIIENENLNIQTTFSFIGKEGLIHLILQSNYYHPDQSLKAIESQYKPNYYDNLVIETRGIDFQPCLFPRIFSYDEKGKLILVYSIAYSQWDAIINNGYARFFSSEKPFLNSKNDYISAQAISGDNHNDIIINRNDYLKFFASSNSIANLRQGKLIIITNHDQ